MKKTIRSVTTSLLAVSLLGISGAVRAAGADDSNETKLEETQRDMDKDASAESAERVQALSRQFKVDPSVVQDLKAKQGWGGVTVELAMAQKLTTTDPKTYPTMQSALDKVSSLRAGGEGWGKIAGDLGFKLGPVVSAAHRAERSFRTEERMERRHERPEGMEERMERPERPEHSERPVPPGGAMGRTAH